MYSHHLEETKTNALKTKLNTAKCSLSESETGGEMVNNFQVQKSFSLLFLIFLLSSFLKSLIPTHQKKFKMKLRGLK